MNFATVILSLLAIAGLIAVGLAQRSRLREAAAWQELLQLVPSQPLTPAETQITEGPISGRITPDHRSEVGHVRLASGDVWRFAFRSHHLLRGTDSFTVFSGPAGTFRVRGDYFCCELTFDDPTAAKDSTQFLSFLRRVHSSVTPVRSNTESP